MFALKYLHMSTNATKVVENLLLLKNVKIIQ